jgi:hypothetical protein
VPARLYRNRNATTRLDQETDHRRSLLRLRRTCSSRLGPPLDSSNGRQLQRLCKFQAQRRAFDTTFTPSIDGYLAALGAVLFVFAGLASFGLVRTVPIWLNILGGMLLVNLSGVSGGYDYPRGCSTTSSLGAGLFFELAACLVGVAALAAYAHTRAQGIPDRADS